MRKNKILPTYINEHSILNLVQEGALAEEKYQEYFSNIKTFTGVNDKDIAAWLGLSERTYGNYKRAQSIFFKPQTRVQILMIMALIQHGKEVFGSYSKFTQWLETENFYFNKKRPMDYMNTSVGLKYIDNRLTAMEYGDNA